MGRDRGHRTVSAEEKTQARQVSLRRIGRLFTPHRPALAAVTAIIVVSSIIAMASPVPAARRDRPAPCRSGDVTAAGLAGRRHGRRRRRDLRPRRRADLDLHPGRPAGHAPAAHRRLQPPAAPVARLLHPHPHRRGAVPDHQRHRRHAVGGHLDRHLRRVQPHHRGRHRGRHGRAVLAALPGLARGAAAGHLADPPGRPDAPRDHRRSGSANSPTSTSPSRRGSRSAACSWPRPSAPAPRWSTGSPPPRPAWSTWSCARELAGRWRMASMSIIFAADPGGHLPRRRACPATAGTLTIGTLVAFTALQGGLFRPLMGLLNVGVSLTASLALFARIFEYLDLPVDVADPADAGPPRPAPGSAATCASRTSPSATRAATPPPSPGSPSTCPPAPPSPWSARPAPARAPSPRWSPGCTTRPPAGSPSTASTCATCAWPTWPRSSAWSARRPTCCTPPSGRTCATPARTPPTPRSRTPPAPPRSTT